MGWLEEEKFRRKKPEFRQKPKHFNLCPGLLLNNNFVDPHK